MRSENSDEAEREINKPQLHLRWFFAPSFRVLTHRPLGVLSSFTCWLISVESRFGVYSRLHAVMENFHRGN